MTREEFKRELERMLVEVGPDGKASDELKLWPLPCGHLRGVSPASVQGLVAVQGKQALDFAADAWPLPCMCDAFKKAQNEVV